MAINAVRSFYGKLLQQDIEPLLHRIKRPCRPARVPRVYSMAEIEKLLTVGTEGNLRACAFLSCVYGGGLRLLEHSPLRLKPKAPTPAPMSTPLLCPHCQGASVRCVARVDASGKWIFFQHAALSPSWPAYLDTS